MNFSKDNTVQTFSERRMNVIRRNSLKDYFVGGYFKKE